jgi:hypothetical protein
MSIALESGRGLGGGPRFGRVARCGYAASPPPSAGRGGSSSVGRDSDSPAAAAQWEWDGEEVEGGDGEVQSWYKGSPFGLRHHGRAPGGPALQVSAHFATGNGS